MTDTSEELLSFPCRFPVKAMGVNTPDFAAHVEKLVSAHIQEGEAFDVQLQPSKAERYLSVTITLTATSRSQLDAIYQDLTDDQQVIMAL